MRKGYIITDEPYFEPILVVSKFTGTFPYHGKFSARDAETGEVIQAATLEKLYRKLAYRAGKDKV